MQDNWDDIRLFLAVARQQSLTAAGRDLRLDPATMGRRIARLEQALGAQLFRKSPRGYALTEAGDRLFDRAEEAETSMRAAVAGVSGGDTQSLSGQIRIGAPDGCANFLLPRVCMEMSKRHPDLDIQIVALPRVFNLSRREADLAIGVSRPTTGRLLVQKITDYRLHFAAAERFLQTHGPVTTLEALNAAPIIGYIPEMIYDRELDYLDDLKIDRVRFASNSVSVQLHMLREGAGLGIVHDFALFAAPGVRRILTDKVSLTRAFYLFRHSADREDRRQSLIAAELVEGLRQEVARREAQAGQES